jgi:hypothetical protein
MEWTINVTRIKTFTEEGSVTVQASSAYKAIEMAKASLDQVEFQPDAAGIEIVPNSVQFGFPVPDRTVSPVIIPIDQSGSGRDGTLSGLTVKEISQKLGFRPNCKDDPYKIKYSWGFMIDGVRCGIWDYKGSYKTKSFSTYGPLDALQKVFGAHVSRD